MDIKANSGVMFRNDKKTGNGPDFKGQVNVDGVLKEIAVWIKTSKAGKEYYSISIEDPYRRHDAIETPPAKIEEQTDDLPF